MNIPSNTPSNSSIVKYYELPVEYMENVKYIDLNYPLSDSLQSLIAEITNFKFNNKLNDAQSYNLLDSKNKFQLDPEDYKNIQITKHEFNFLLRLRRKNIYPPYALKFIFEIYRNS